MEKSLLILKDADIFKNPNPEPEHYQDRIAVKVIVFDSDGKIALVGKTNRLLPGGGVDNGETLEEAVRRECLEEIGCEAVISSHFGVTEEYRAKSGRHQFTHFYIAKVSGNKGVPSSTQEDEQEMKVEWFPIDKALESLEKQKDAVTEDEYNKNFNVRTQLFMLARFLASKQL